MYAFTAPAVPDAGAELVNAAGNLTTQFFGIFSDVLPYGAALIGLAWGFGVVKGMLGAKKKKPA